MKTILVATDFSATANNALDYAVEIAKHTGAKLFLFHSYNIPVVTTEVPQANFISYNEIEKENERQIEKIKAVVKTKAPEVNLESKVVPGFPVQEINDMAKEQKADLIVMGIKGMGKAEEFLIGSTSTGVAKGNKTPVLIIPDGAKFTTPKNIVLACDYKEDFTNENFIEKLKAFVKLFDSTLFVINVVKPNEIPDFKKAVTGLKLDTYLQGIPHFQYYPEGEDVVATLNDFIARTNVDMVITLRHEHSLFDKIFHRSNSKKIAFHTHIPMLALHAG